MQLYDKLLGLPLFQGMSSSDLQDIVTRVKFGFLRFTKNQTIAAVDQPCKGLLFLLDGDVEVASTSDDHQYSVIESLPAPYILEPERIFGLYQRYAHQYTARTQCHFLYVGKDDVMLLSDEFMVFRLNLLNILSTMTQRHQRQLWHQHPDDVEARVRLFLRSHVVVPSGKKVFHIKMQQLADEINAARLDVSNVLNALDDAGIIVLQRGIITVPEVLNL